MKAGMNWTAWNSVRAKALARSPSAMPRVAFPIASRPTSQAPWGESRPSARKPTEQTTIACRPASRPKAIP